MADKKDDIENWQYPDLNDREDNDGAQEKSLFGKPAAWYKEKEKKVEKEQPEDPIKPLTLDDIEAIRQSAYEDGFNEGKDAGFAQGLEEGKVEGLEKGHSEGLEKGTQEGLLQGAEKIEQQVNNWQSLIERLHHPLEKLDENAEYQLIRLATSLAEQITRCEVLTSPQIILQALKQAVDVLPISEQKLTIKLHPEDLLFVQEAYTPEQCLQRGWDLQAEPALLRGDCQIHTQASSVDFAFSSRIEQVLKNFFKENHQQLPAKNDDSDLTSEQQLKTPDASEVEDISTDQQSPDKSNETDSKDNLDE